MKRKKRHLSELELLTMKKILLSNAITDISSWG